MVASPVVNGQRLPSQVHVYDRVEQVSRLVSHPAEGRIRPGGADSRAPAISDDGGAVAFLSNARLEGSGDPADPPVARVFVWQRNGDGVTPVSVSVTGAAANASCGSPAISAAGTLVAYACLADNLVPNDFNEAGDVFVTDLAASPPVTTVVSVGPDGERASGDSCDATPAGRCEGRVSLSGDGRFVAFASAAANLVGGMEEQGPGGDGETPPSVPNGGSIGPAQLQQAPDQDANELTDVFVRDLGRQVTVRASVLPGGEEISDGESHSPSLSDGGRRVAFVSSSAQLTDGGCSGDACSSGVFVREDTAICGPCQTASCPPPPDVPFVEMTSGIVAQGRVTMAVGRGFQPSATVEISTPLRPVEVTTTETGTFEAPIVVPRRSLLGAQSLVARSGTRSAKASYFVVRPSEQPPFRTFP